MENKDKNKEKYMNHSRIFKALSDSHRLAIAEMLAKKEFCACHILAEFHISQSTLSHHMKILCDAKIVNARRDGKWMYYSLNRDTLQCCKEIFTELILSYERCCKI